MKEDEKLPYHDAPMAEPRFGQPDDCGDLINKYGTYNIQPTADTENVFPLIAHALPEKWHDMMLESRILRKKNSAARTPRSETESPRLPTDKKFWQK